MTGVRPAGPIGERRRRLQPSHVKNAELKNRRSLTAMKERGRGRTYGNAIRVLLANALGLGLALLEGVLVLELASHFGGVVGRMLNSVGLL